MKREEVSVDQHGNSATVGKRKEALQQRLSWRSSLRSLSKSAEAAVGQGAMAAPVGA